MGPFYVVSEFTFSSNVKKRWSIPINARARRSNTCPGILSFSESAAFGFRCLPHVVLLLVSYQTVCGPFISTPAFGTAGTAPASPGEEPLAHSAVPASVTFQAEEADWFGGELTTDAYAHDGSAVRVSPASKLYGETVLSGLGGVFAAGGYSVMFYLRAEGGLGSAKPIAELAVARGDPEGNDPSAVTDLRTVTGAVFASEDTYSAITLPVKLRRSEELDFRVRYIGNAVLYIDRITVKAESSPDDE